MTVRIGNEVYSDDFVYSDTVCDMRCENCGDYIATVSACEFSSSLDWYCQKSECQNDMELNCG